MENNELLQAMQAMMKEEISGLRQEMNEEFNDVTERLDTMQTDITAMQEDIAEIKEDTTITRSATNSLVEWADEVGVLTQIKFPVKKAK